MSVFRTRDYRLLLGILTCAILSLVLLSDGFSEDQKKGGTNKGVITGSNDNGNHPNSKTTSGYRVFIDPKTGEFLESPKDKISDTTSTRSANPVGSSETLVEEAAPGGGVMVVLPDGFHYFSTATVDGKGGISILCSKDGYTGKPK